MGDTDWANVEPYDDSIEDDPTICPRGNPADSHHHYAAGGPAWGVCERCGDEGEQEMRRDG